MIRYGAYWGAGRERDPYNAMMAIDGFTLEGHSDPKTRGRPISE